MPPRLILAAVAVLLPATAAAQSMPGMTMPAPGQTAPAPAPSPPPMTMPMPMATPSAGGMDMIPAGNASPGSGTARLPAADGAMSGLHWSPGGWMMMAHGYALGAYTSQGGPRGHEMAYSGSMAMLEAERDFAGGTRLQLKLMVSLDPLNGKRGYPNLFASGETANGAPLIDRQHPHDLFMELSARIDVPVGGGVTAFAYGGPVAEPALGPSAFVHRRSARYFPDSPIAHHWFDSTHVTFGVVTAGLATNTLQLEGSAFRGREPDENRWDIETPKLDSWSLRASWSPTPNWAAQLSYGQLHSPEALEPGADEHRTTATVHYSRGGFSAMAGFAAKDRVPGRTLTAWIGEANWDLTRHHSLFGRIENVANDELFPAPADPRHGRTFRVTRFEGGYAYQIPLGIAELALGGSAAAYAKPAALDSAYGRAPVSVTGFVRLAIGS